MMKKDILTIQEVSKTFPRQISFTDLLTLNLKNKTACAALDNISFSLEKGKILGILGENGAGKTTLLKIISTLILPNTGSVRVKDYHLDKDDEKIKALIGLATIEERSFYWRLTGMQNLEFFASLYGLTRQEAKARINNLLVTFKIDYAGNRFDSYSTGMKRNFSIIKSLLHNPEILLLDEPTKSLDYTSAHNLRNLIKTESKAGRTILLATHNMEEAEQLCDLFLIIHKGKLCRFGTLADLRQTLNAPSAHLPELYLKLTSSEGAS